MKAWQLETLVLVVVWCACSGTATDGVKEVALDASECHMKNTELHCNYTAVDQVSFPYTYRTELQYCVCMALIIKCKCAYGKHESGSRE